MPKETAHIFIDEFGTNVFIPNSVATTSHFMYVSVIISESNLEKAREVLTELSHHYRQGSPLVSKKFDKKDKDLQKRINLITDLASKLDFTIDLLVIDKSKIDGDGLKNKRTFYKYFHKLFLSKYRNRYESFHINADKIGDDLFARELKQYVNEIVAGDLFNPDRFYKLSNEDTIENPLLQLVDMVCGSLGKFYVPSHFHERSSEIFEVLHSRINIDFFPKYEIISEEKLKGDKEINIKVRNIAIKSLSVDITKVSDSELAERILEYLYSHFKANPNRYVQTYELKSYLKNFAPDIKTEKIRRLIRDLRYEGAFIISVSSQNGYKIANDLNDIFQYFTHYSNYFIPMLKKIQIVNKEISNDSFNSINFLEKDENFKLFQKLILAVDSK